MRTALNHTRATFGQWRAGWSDAMRPWAWSGGFIAFLAAAAQPLEGQYSRPSGGYTLDLVAAPVADAIRAELRSAEPEWDRVLQLFFGADGYDRGAPDLVVYLPRTGAAKQALVHRGRVVRNLVGQTFLYVVVFSERAFERDSTGPHLTLGVRYIETAEDPFLTALVKALASRLGASVPEPEFDTGEDSVLGLTLHDVRADTLSGERLDVAMGRVRLGPNSLNRVTLTAADGFDIEPHVSLHHMFGNSDGSRFGVSLGGGFTLNVRRPVFDGGDVTATEDYLRTSLYILGEAYLNRPNLPHDRFSFGLAVGTNLLKGDVLDDLVVGVSVGRISDLGLVVGANSLHWQEPVAGSDRLRETRRWRPFVGLDFRL